MLITARPYSQPRSQETWAQLVVQSSILKLIERTTSDFDPTRYDRVKDFCMLVIRCIHCSLHDQVRRTLNALLEALESALLPLARRLVEIDPRELDQFLSSEQINAWSHMLSLRRWLGINRKFTKDHLVTIQFMTLF